MNVYDEKEVKKQLSKDLLALGAAAPAYCGAENLRDLLAYLQRYCAPYLRGLVQKGAISSFRFGISPVFFFNPKVRVVCKNGHSVDLALAGLYKIQRHFLGGKQ